MNQEEWAKKVKRRSNKTGKHHKKNGVHQARAARSQNFGDIKVRGKKFLEGIWSTCNKNMERSGVTKGQHQGGGGGRRGV